MRTPELIKKGLECCTSHKNMCVECPYCDVMIGCKQLDKDSLAYIQQLEAGIDHAEKVARECAKSITENLNKLQAKLFQLESDNESKQKRIEELESSLAQVERERDALMAYVPHNCYSCKHEETRYECGRPCNWEWRGVCADDTEEG